MRTAKESISQSERLQLIGLATVAGKMNQQFYALEDAVMAVTGEVNDDGKAERGGHSADLIYSDGDPVRMVDEMLDKLGISVAE